MPTTELINLLEQFFHKYWNDTGFYECDGNYSYVLNSDLVELDEIASKIEDLKWGGKDGGTTLV